MGSLNTFVPNQPADRPASGSSYIQLPRNATILVGIWAFFVFIALWMCQFGRYAIPATSGDFALNMQGIETRYYNATLPAGQSPLDSGDAEHYPHWSFDLVAHTALFLDLNPLRAQQVWISIALVSGAFLVALRLMFVPARPPSVMGVLLAAVFLAACAFMGFGLPGHVVQNFFFAALFGTVLAIGAFTLLEHIRSTRVGVLIGIIIVGGIVLPNVHLAPAVWFISSALLFIFFEEINIKLAVLKCIVVGGITTFFLMQTEGATMIQHSQNNGWFVTRLGNITLDGASVAIVLSIVLLLVLVALLIRIRNGGAGTVRQRLAPYSGLLAVCGLICLQGSLHVFLNQGSVYAVVKYSYLLVIEVAALVASIRWPSIGRVEEWFNRNPDSSRILAVLLLFVAQMPFVDVSYDQTTLMKYRERLLEIRDSIDYGRHQFPQFSGLGLTRNYYLAVAVMRIPRDAAMAEWLKRDGQGADPFVLPGGNAVASAVREKEVAPPPPKPGWSDVQFTPNTGEGSEAVFRVSLRLPSPQRGGSKVVLVGVLINNRLDGGNACYVYRDLVNNDDRLVADDVSGSTLRGAAPSVANNQCEVLRDGSSATLDASELHWSLHVRFRPAFRGRKEIYLIQQDANGAYSDFKTMGQWTVE
jgi:hypothetical protein